MKISYLSCLLLIIIFLYSCSDKKTPQDKQNCTEQLYQQLKTFDPNNKQLFAAGFISLETLHKIGNDKLLIWNDQKEYANMSQSDYKAKIIDNAYTFIQNKGNSFGIVWNKIELMKCVYMEQGQSSFVLDNQEYKSPESMRGRLVFRYKRKLFDVESLYIKYDSIWHLLSISRFAYRAETNLSLKEQPFED